MQIPEIFFLNESNTKLISYNSERDASEIIRNTVKNVKYRTEFPLTIFSIFAV